MTLPSRFYKLKGLLSIAFLLFLLAAYDFSPSEVAEKEVDPKIKPGISQKLAVDIYSIKGTIKLGEQRSFKFNINTAGLSLYL